MLHLSGTRLKVFADNENAFRIVSVGSSKHHIQCLALDICQLCLVNDTQIDTQWISRDANVRADLLSCFVDKDDWCLNCEIFAQLDSRWGPHSVDRFASHYNAQLSRFNSRFLSPGCCAVDGLSQDKHDENNWLCPPVSIIVDVISHVRACHAVGTLIVPEWPLLTPRPSKSASLIVDVVCLPRKSDLMIDGHGKIFIAASPQFLWLPKIHHAGLAHRFPVSIADLSVFVYMFVFVFIFNML